MAPPQTMHVGNIAVSFLPDGEARFVPTAIFPASRPDGWAPHAEWLDGDGRYVATLGAFLIRSGERTVLVDLGLGPGVTFEYPGLVAGRSGRLLESLHAAGAAPEDVDTVVYTHLHADHAGWTSGGGALTFPNARHVVAAAELEFWRANPQAPFAPSADAVLDPMASRVALADDGQIVAPGVTLRATPGHTPGHQSVLVAAGAERLVIMGDVLICPVQLVEAEWDLLFDVDAGLARRTRQALLDEIEAGGSVMACGHFPGTVFGRVLRGTGTRYWHTT